MTVYMLTLHFAALTYTLKSLTNKLKTITRNEQRYSFLNNSGDNGRICCLLQRFSMLCWIFERFCLLFLRWISMKSKNKQILIDYSNGFKWRSSKKLWIKIEKQKCFCWKIHQWMKRYTTNLFSNSLFWLFLMWIFAYGKLLCFEAMLNCPALFILLYLKCALQDFCHWLCRFSLGFRGQISLLDRPDHGHCSVSLVTSTYLTLFLALVVLKLWLF